MARYTVTTDDCKFGRVEALPAGTSRQDGMTFAEAKRVLVEWLKNNEETYREAKRQARKFTREDAKKGRCVEVDTSKFSQPVEGDAEADEVEKSEEGGDE